MISKRSWKLTTISAILLFLIIPSILSLGTLSYKSSKETEKLQTSFKIGLINSENISKEIDLGYTSGEDLEVEFERKSFVLEPSEVTRSPKGEGWVYLGEEKYAKPEKVRFKATISPSSNKRHHSFKVTVTSRSSERTETEANIKQKILQERELSFNLYTTSGDLNVQKEKQENQEFDKGLWKVEREGEELENNSGKNISDSRNLSGSPKRNLTHEKQNETKKNNEIVTYGLAAGIVICLIIVVYELL